jgi:hypothetical protein
MLLSSRPIGGHWAGWSCAYSVYGAPLPLPDDLCLPDAPAYGFRELNTESFVELPAPATGTFVDRQTARLMPNPKQPVMERTMGQTQIVAVGGGFVQDAHYEDDVWVVQTVLPGAHEAERKRIAFLFDSSRGQLAQGIRVWQEQRCSIPRPLVGCSSDELAAMWATATSDVGCFASADTRAPPLSDTLSTGRVVVPAVGLTVRVARGLLVVEPNDGRPTAERQPFVRSFEGGTCYIRSGGALGRHVSARATRERSARSRL